MSKNLLAYLVREKPAKVLTTLLEKPKNVRSIEKDAGVIYCYLFKLLDTFNDLGLVEFEKKGRQRIVRLTEKGEEIALLFKKLFDFEKENQK